jgi:hypothetical protein
MITTNQKTKEEFIKKFANWYVFEQYPEYTPDDADIIKWLDENIRVE